MSRPDALALGPWAMQVAESVHNLLAMGQRSWLGLLGIAVGSASIVALLNIGRSASDDAMATFKGLGTDVLVASFPGFDSRRTPMPGTLDTRSVHFAMPELMQLAPVSQYAVKVRAGGAELDATVIGTSAALMPVMGLELASGRFISRLDRNGLFAVIGDEAASALGIETRPLQPGDLLGLGDYQFQIIGILRPQPHNPLLPVPVGSSVFIPAHSMARLSSSIRLGHVIAKVQPNVDASVAAQSLQRQLQERLRGHEVNVQVPRQLLDGLRRQADIFAWLLAGLGGISLLVAGVGVMNVMLMSVRERRREIGVRMALGARPRDIRSLFLIEAAHLSVVGALLGAAFGCGIAWLFTQLNGWPLNLSFDALLLGVGSSLMTGLFFGCYPAALAARLSPAVALRDD